MKLISALLVFFPLAVIAQEERGIESLDTVSHLGELCEFYSPVFNIQKFTKPIQAYRAGLCVGFVTAKVNSWLSAKFEGCGLTPGASLEPVFAAIRKTYRLKSLRDPDQQSRWFINTPDRLLDDAVFNVWDEKLDASDCPRMISDEYLAPAEGNN